MGSKLDQDLADFFGFPASSTCVILLINKQTDGPTDKETQSYENNTFLTEVMMFSNKLNNESCYI